MMANSNVLMVLSGRMFEYAMRTSQSEWRSESIMISTATALWSFQFSAGSHMSDDDVLPVSHTGMWNSRILQMYL